MPLILTMTHMFDHDGGRYSILADNDHFMVWIMEREWKYNRRNVSCVPRDEYTLQRHNGGKYKNTWALIGDGVGHFREDGKPRYACVIHQAIYPSSLEGCLSPARSIDVSGAALGSREATEELLAFLDLHEDEEIKILCQ